MTRFQLAVENILAALLAGKTVMYACRSEKEARQMFEAIHQRVSARELARFTAEIV